MTKRPPLTEPCRAADGTARAAPFDDHWSNSLATLCSPRGLFEPNHTENIGLQHAREPYQIGLRNGTELTQKSVPRPRSG
jgi:hypothetical protein